MQLISYFLFHLLPTVHCSMFKCHIVASLLSVSQMITCDQIWKSTTQFISSLQHGRPITRMKAVMYPQSSGSLFHLYLQLLYSPCHSAQLDFSLILVFMVYFLLFKLSFAKSFYSFSASSCSVNTVFLNCSLFLPYFFFFFYMDPKRTSKHFVEANKDTHTVNLCESRSLTLNSPNVFTNSFRRQCCWSGQISHETG